MKPLQSPEVNWQSLLKRLTAVAITWLSGQPGWNDDSVLPGTGMSAKDLAYAAVLEFLKNEEKYHPRSDQERFV